MKSILIFAWVNAKTNAKTKNVLSIGLHASILIYIFNFTVHRSRSLCLLAVLVASRHPIVPVQSRKILHPLLLCSRKTSELLPNQNFYSLHSFFKIRKGTPAMQKARYNMHKDHQICIQRRPPVRKKLCEVTETAVLKLKTAWVLC